jgi:uncharacterized delta-60 repeat protein
MLISKILHLFISEGVMKNFFLLVLLFSIICFNYADAQVDTSWVRRFNGPTNSEDDAKIIKVDNNGFIYVGGVVSTIPGYLNYGVIKYTPYGDSVWFRYYNSPVNRESLLRDMAIDYNNNIIVTGSSYGNNYTDYATVKWDSDGNLLWAKRFDGGDVDQAFALDVDGSGNICVTGTSNDNYFTIKYNPAGDTLWTNNFNVIENSSDVARAIAVDNTGSIIVSGGTDYYWGTIDFVTIKLNPSGDTVWTAQYNSPQNGYDYFSAMALDGSNNIYVTGEIYNIGGNHDIITIKYNPYGDTVWTRRYSGPANGDDKVYAFAVDNSGNVFITGSSYYADTGFDYLIIKYNTSGVQQWIRTYAGLGYSNYLDYAYSIALDDLGNSYVTGATEMSTYDFDYATIKYDSDGNEKWVIKYNGTGELNDYANSVCVDNSGYVYVTGFSVGVGTGFDFATIKYTQTPSSLEENPQNIPAVFKLYENYPNPFNPGTVISYQLPIGGNVMLKVFDVLGNEVATLVDEYKPAGSYEVEFNATNLPSGVYFYQFKAGDFVQTKKMVLMK